jgi:hypothetical protein
VKIVWVSPHGDGWSLAYRLREMGNKVVLYNPTNKNGQGYLPQVTSAAWMDYARKADLVVCDGVPESRKTRRSWSSSDLSVDLQQLRHSGIPVLGPTPTTELLHNDPRYRKKILVRHGLDIADEHSEGIRVTISRDPNGAAWLVFRHRHLLGDGNGPELGNLGDVVLPTPSNPLVQRTVGKFDSFLSTIGYRGYLNLDLVITQRDLKVRDVTTGFLYPASFVQLPNLLISGADQPVVPGLAVSILNLKSDEGDTLSEELLDKPGVFGAELHRKPDEGGTFLHGRFVGAVVGINEDWARVEADVYGKLAAIVNGGGGLGYRPGVGLNVGSHMSTLRAWGYL